MPRGEYDPPARTCRDYRQRGVECCAVCHEYPDEELEVVLVDGETALLCCALRRFFYPGGHESRLSPEERLLRAIFGCPHAPDSFDD